MLDLARLDRIRLSARPRFQEFVARVLLYPTYELAPRVRIDLEGVERVPREPVIFAMNHTDRFNYWPFQYAWWGRHGRFTATWVKGKYYENRAVGLFMELANNIPTVSRGYLITKDAIATLGRRPSDEEYEALRDLVDAAARGETQSPSAVIPQEILTQKRSVLGLAFDPAREPYGEAIDRVFRLMMRRFVALNRGAAELGLDLLIFPQGTRSTRLTRGHGGIAQIAMHLGRTVVPVGCSGSDRVYPGGSPIARPGHVIYRIGEPIRPADAVAWVHEAFEPFSSEAERAHGETFQRYVDEVMRRIDPLLDAEYRRDPDAADLATGEASTRFV